MGLGDPRGSLFMDFIRMIDYMRPRFFVMENVEGIMSAPPGNGPQPGRDKSAQRRQGSALEIIIHEFERLGYKTAHGILDAVNYGAPQFRERFILIGSRDGEDIFLPLPTHFQMHQEEACRWRTLRQAIGGLESDCGECAAFSEERAAYLRLIPEGGNWRDLPKGMQKAAMGGAYGASGGKAGFYRRLSYTSLPPHW